MKASSTRKSAGICRSCGATWPPDGLFRRFDVFLPEFASLNIRASENLIAAAFSVVLKGV